MEPMVDKLVNRSVNEILQNRISELGSVVKGKIIVMVKTILEDEVEGIQMQLDASLF